MGERIQNGDEIVDDSSKLIGYRDPDGTNRYLVMSSSKDNPLATELAAIGATRNVVPESAEILLADIVGDYVLSGLPTPYSAVASHVLHPSPVYVDGGFCGYKYWMAYTPYPGGDSQYENPCICASNDYVNWELPTGCPNPVFERPAAPGYSADTNLMFDSANQRLVLVWRDRNTGGDNLNKLQISFSSNGKTWSEKVTIWSGSITNNDMGSPSLFWDYATSKWTIIGVNLDDANRPLRKITSAALESGWDTSATALTSTPPSGRKWWHGQFIGLQGGKIAGIVQDNDGTAGQSGKLYWMMSPDGVNFYYRKFDDRTVWYKPGFCVRLDESNKPIFDLAFSRSSSDSIYFSQAKIKGSSPVGVQRGLLGAELQMASSCPSAILMGDDFNRTDSSSAIGTATSGATYTQVGAGSDVIGISANRAYNATANNCRAHADVGTADFEAKVVFADPGTQCFLMFRFTDSSNFYRVGATSLGGPLAFQKILAGAIAISLEIGGTLNNGDIVAARCAGDFIQILHNGAVVYELHDAAFISATKVGLQASGATASYFDSLTVVSL